MKNISDVILESRTSPLEIKKYGKSWAIQCQNYDDYQNIIQNFLKGFYEGVKDNTKYYKGEELDDAKDILSLIDDMLKLK